MKIKVIDIERLFSLTIEKLNKLNITEVDINTDYYKKILTSEWDNIYENVEPAIGSLNEDLLNLQKVLLNENSLTFLDFERLASVLRAVSEQIVSSKKA